MKVAALAGDIFGSGRPSAPADDGLDAAKIAAFALMAVNHSLIAFPEPWRTLGYLAGRPCLPIFASIMVLWLAAGSPERAWRMLGHLLIWGALAQPFYYLLVGSYTLRLNVMFTLAAGAALILLTMRRRYFWLAPAIVALVLADPWLDGGAATPVAELAAFFVVRRSFAGAVAVITLAEIADDLFTVPQLWQAGLTALAGPFLLWLSPALRGHTPRLPRMTFYALYPLHLAVIWLVLGPYR